MPLDNEHSHNELPAIEPEEEDEKPDMESQEQDTTSEEEHTTQNKWSEEEKDQIREQIRKENVKEQNKGRTSLYDLLFRIRSNWFDRSEVDDSTLPELELYLKSYRAYLVKRDALTNTLTTYLRTTYPSLHPYSEWLDVLALLIMLTLALAIPRSYLLVSISIYSSILQVFHPIWIIVLIKFLRSATMKEQAVEKHCTMTSLITILVITVAVVVALINEWIRQAWILVAVIIMIIIYMIYYSPTLIQKSPTTMFQYCMLIAFLLLIARLMMTPLAVIWMQIKFPLARVERESERILNFYDNQFIAFFNQTLEGANTFHQYVTPNYAGVSYSSYQFSNVPCHLWSMLMLMLTHAAFKCLSHATLFGNSRTADHVIQAGVKKEDRILTDFETNFAFISYPWYFMMISIDIFGQMWLSLSVSAIVFMSIPTYLLSVYVSNIVSDHSYNKIYERTSKSLVASSQLQNKNISYGHFPNIDENINSLKYYNTCLAFVLAVIHILPRLCYDELYTVVIIVVTSSGIFIIYFVDAIHRDSQKYYVLFLCIVTSSWISLAIFLIFLWTHGRSYRPFQQDITPRASGIPHELSPTGF